MNYICELNSLKKINATPYEIVAEQWKNTSSPYSKTLTCKWQWSWKESPFWLGL